MAKSQAQVIQDNNAAGKHFEARVELFLRANQFHYDEQRVDGGTVTDFEILDRGGDRIAIVEAKSGKSWGREDQLYQLIDRTADRCSYVTSEGKKMLMIASGTGKMPKEVNDPRVQQYAQTRGVEIRSINANELKNLKPIAEFLATVPPDKAVAWLGSQAADGLARISSEIKQWIEGLGPQAVPTLSEIKAQSLVFSSWLDDQGRLSRASYPRATSAIRAAAAVTIAGTAGRAAPIAGVTQGAVTVAGATAAVPIANTAGATAAITGTTGTAISLTSAVGTAKTAATVVSTAATADTIAHGVPIVAAAGAVAVTATVVSAKPANAQTIERKQQNQPIKPSRQPNANTSTISPATTKPLHTMPAKPTKASVRPSSSIATTTKSSTNLPLKPTKTSSHSSATDTGTASTKPSGTLPSKPTRASTQLKPQPDVTSKRSARDPSHSDTDRTDVR